MAHRLAVFLLPFCVSGCAGLAMAVASGVVSALAGMATEQIVKEKPKPEPSCDWEIEGVGCIVTVKISEVGNASQDRRQ